ncbi:MAG TPA: sigma-70 family RNA polymerase sigma factor [Marmoricola sp.]|nr:sigma-70 family RNA polymerase sigma factor [Marmoricola sp.]
MSSPGPDHHDRFRELYARHFDALLGYALRRVSRPEDAADVVADTFLIAWRRRAHLPGGAEDKLWLYGVARNLLANHRRGDRRRDRLGAALRERLAASADRWAPDPSAAVTGEVAVRDALARLGPLDREVLTLTVWEELEPREIAEVLGINAQAVRTRLSRARARLREVLGDDVVPAGHVMQGSTPAALEEDR